MKRKITLIKVIVLTWMIMASTLDCGGLPVSAADSDTYYEGTKDLSKEELKAVLNNIITTDHYELTYSQAYTALEDTDEDPDDPSKVVLFYKGISVPDGGVRMSDDGDIWNREHVWAKSHGDFGTSKGPGTDIHMLRPTDASVNSKRGHLDFDESDNEISEAPGNFYDKDSFEPRDEVKGDVARILFYMATRYEGENGEVDLELSDSLSTVSATTTSYGEHGSLETLLLWHELDPVDEFELNRNDVVESIQGNRNPYIDHPEFVDLVWGDGILDKSQEADSELDTDGETVDVDIDDNSESESEDTQTSDVISIEEARLKDKNENVKVKGVVSFIEKSTAMYIQDESGGIKVDTYNMSVSLDSYYEGELVSVAGKIDFYKDELEISVSDSMDIMRLKENQQMLYKHMTLEELKEGKKQGELIIIENLKITDIGQYVMEVINENGSSGYIYHGNAVDFTETNYSLGSSYDIIGVAAWYDGAQLKIMSGEDIIESSVDEQEEEMVETPVFEDLYMAPWAREYIINLARKGIVNGTSDTTFEPNEPLTREAFIKMLVESFDLLNLDDETSFTDIEKDAWYYDYIASAQTAGITNGKGNGTFGLGDIVTREQMATLSYRAMNAVGSKKPVISDVILYADDNLISGYAIESVYKMYQYGILSGKGNNEFAPKDMATRAEAAKVIHLLIEE